MAQIKIFLRFVCLYFFIIYVTSIKLNVPRVLLPYTQTVTANFTLEVTDGGCFNWYVSRPEVVKLHLLDEELAGCSSRAVVTSVSRQPSQQSALVIIRNEATGETLHCDVTVVRIHELEITTTTRELLLEDTPEAFTLRAKDKEGDTFSSIDGLVFEWNLVTDTGSEEIIDAYKVLRFMKFSESLYKASASIYRLESQGLRGFMMLVQGIKTGTAIVRTVLKDAAYADSLSAEVTLTVVANLILWPSHEIHVLVGSIWKYEVHLIKHRKSTKIVMPSTQYYLTLTDENVAMLDAETSEIEAQHEGFTFLLLNDRNIRKKPTFRQPSVGIHVVAPHHLGFTVLPHQNWYLILSNEYTIIVRVYDVANNEIFITDNVRVQTMLSEEHFDIIHQTKNGTYIHVRTKKTGSTKCTASLSALNDKTGYEVKLDVPLEESQEIEIGEQVHVMPNVVVLPWDPVTKPSYKFHLTVAGGGSYGFHWKSSNSSIAVCDHFGDVTTKCVGSVNITASSMRNLHNYDFSTVSIIPPSVIEILTPATEIEQNKIVDVSIALFTRSDTNVSKMITITDCTQYPFKLDVSDPKKLQSLPDKIKPSAMKRFCAAIPFLAVSAGLVRVTVSGNTEEGVIQSSVAIVVYKPLTTVFPASLEESVILTVGTSCRIVLEGGPKPWPAMVYNYFQELEIEKNSIVSARLVESSNINNNELHMIDVLCKALGETKIVLRVGNRNSTAGVKSAVAEAELNVLCTYPATMQLHPVILRPRLSSGVCLSNSRAVVAHCYRDFEIEVRVFDEQGRRFHNFSSLDIAWDLSDSNLASLGSAVVTMDNIHDGFITHNRSYVALKPKGVEGRIQISAVILTYKDNVLHAAGIFSKVFGLQEVKSKIFIDLVDDASFVESVVSVFNHPSNKVSVSVVKGSGLFDYDPKDQTIAEVQYNDKLHEFQIIPKSEGSFTLTLVDICLESRSDAVTLVRVSGMRKIRVNLLDKVGLGKEIFADVEILDQDGKFLPQSVLSLINVQSHVASNIISVRSVSVLDSSSLALRFAVKGNSLGHTTLSFTANRKLAEIPKLDTTVSSDRLPIQVFSPLKLFPHNITLIVGAVFQVLSSGGPSPQANIEFEVEHSGTVNVGGGGIIEGKKLGMTAVFGRAVGIDSDTGSRIVYSEDMVFVHVIYLTGIRIRSPITRLQSGAVIPVYAVGINDQEIPFAFGSTIPSLTFHWSSNNKDIASLQPLFHGCGIDLLDNNHFATRLEARQPGQITLTLKVLPSQQGSDAFLQIYDNAILTDEIQIQVFEKLSLLSPHIQNEIIVVTCETEMKLLTNKDKTSIIHYQLVESACVSSTGITVDRSGLLHSGKEECQASLLITSVDETGSNQTVSSLIMVKPISYMVVMSKCSFQVKDKLLNVLPIGVEVSFVVKFYDNMGNMFHVTNSRLKFRPSRFDLIHIVPGRKNDTFYVRANKPGFTVVRVWDNANAGIEDYVLISTGEIISPSGAVALLGDRLCFNCVIADSQGAFGTWHTDDYSVIKILKNGIGFATNIGTAAVVYNVSNKIITSTEVTVVPLQSIEFDSVFRSKFLTNAHTDKIFHFPLVLRSDKMISRQHSTNILGGNCSSSQLISVPSPFECIIRFANNELEKSAMEVFNIRESFDLSSGRHECQVQAKILQPQEARHFSTMIRDVEIVAVIRDNAKQEKLSSDVLHLPFHPAFFVHNLDVQVGDGQLVGNGLTITATNTVFRHLSVKSNDSMLVDVLSAFSDATNPSQHLFPIKMGDQFWMRMAVEGAVVPHVHLEVYCSLTEQTVRVPVKFTLLTDKLGKCVEEYERIGWGTYVRRLAENYQGFAIIMVAIIGTVIAMFIGYHATIGQRNYIVSPQSGVYLNQSLLGSGRAYPPGAPGFNTSISPGMQCADRPHLWSVNEPVHGSPTFTRTPSPPFRSTDRYVVT